MNKKIAIIKTDKYYYPKGVFSPSVKYPEYLFDDINENENHVYDMIRDGFIKLKLDAQNYGKSCRNPLGKYIKKGDKVVLKPNLVMDQNPSGGGTECLYTQPSIVAAIIDYTIIALKGKGEIVVGDAPMQSCNFEKLINDSGYKKMIESYQKKLKDKNISIRLEDFRDLKSTIIGGVHHQNINKNSNGIVVDLGNKSEFSSLTKEEYKNLRITNYDPRILNSHHNTKKNEYLINKTILEADTIINIPKPKTHRKAGITISLKNLIGVNTRKEYLPHHMNGSKSNNSGDEYLFPSFTKKLIDILLDIKNKLINEKKYTQVKFTQLLITPLLLLSKKFSKDNYIEGSWYGNNTISKTIVDMHKIIHYADINGNINNKIQRNYFIVADMIISGEKEGPLLPSPKKVGLIAMGENSVSFDEIIGTLMGAKMELNPTILCAKKSLKKWKLYNNKDKYYIISNDKNLNKKTIKDINKNNILYFKPSSGWEKVFLKEDT